MKKVLVIFLAFLILTNFHCARFNMQTAEADKILGSCRAILLDDSGDTAQNQIGILVLTENSLRFVHKEKTREIPYSHISSMDVQGNIEKGIPQPAPFSFTKKSDLAWLTVAFFGTLLMTLAFLIYMTSPSSCINSDSKRVDLYLLPDSEFEKATFKLDSKALFKIYPILVEKIG